MTLAELLADPKGYTKLNIYVCSECKNVFLTPGYAELPLCCPYCSYPYEDFYKKPKERS